jgi:hypothetical protein
MKNKIIDKKDYTPYGKLQIQGHRFQMQPAPA